MSKYEWRPCATGYVEQLYSRPADLRVVLPPLPLAEVYRYQMGFKAVWFDPAMLLGVFDTIAEAKTAVEVLAPILEART